MSEQVNSHKGSPPARGWGHFRPRPWGRVGGEPGLRPGVSFLISVSEKEGQHAH